jgi:hypothetical protein
MLVDALMQVARTGWADGPMQRVVLETTSTWTDTIRFYERCGFAATHVTDGPFGPDTWFERSTVQP